MYQRTGKPSISKFRSRLARIQECSETGAELARRWNPKGRNAAIQIDLIKFFDESEKIATMFQKALNGRRI